MFGTRGVAGGRKNHLQREVRRGLEEVRTSVIAIAPTASAAKTLRRGILPKPTTAADFLQNGASRFDLRGAVVICDGSGTAIQPAGRRICWPGSKTHMRVIFVGDVGSTFPLRRVIFLRGLETPQPI